MVAKLMSGRFLLTMAAGVVFVVCAMTNTMSAEAVGILITMVFKDYFQRNDRQTGGTK